MPPARRQHRQLLDLQKAGVFTTEDPQGKLNVFKEYQNYRLFPPEFRDAAEMQLAVKDLIKKGRTKKEAMAALGIKVDVFESNGNIKGRIFRDRMSPGLEDTVDSRTDHGTAQQLSALERKYWNAGVAENRMIAPTLGMAVNEGHIDTSASGAPASNRAAGLESAVTNQMNGRSAANPSRPVSDFERANIGVANTKIAGLYEAALQQSGLPARSGTERLLNPYVSGLLGSDQQTRYIPKDQLEVFNRTFQDLADQDLSEVAMYDHVKSGGATDPESLAQAGLKQYGVSTFATPPETQAPVRTLVPPNPPGPSVTTYVTPKSKAATKVTGTHTPPTIDLPNTRLVSKLTTGGLLSGAAMSLLMGESPAQAFASNIPILSDIESDNNGMAERAGQLFVDPRTNRLMPTNAAQVGKGLAYLNGNPVAVPYGSVAGIKSNGEIAKESVRQIADVNSKRLSKVTSAAAPVLKKASQFIPKPLSPFQPLVDAYRGFNKIIANIVRD